jgi:hypothetical protein
LGAFYTARVKKRHKLLRLPTAKSTIEHMGKMCQEKTLTGATFAPPRLLSREFGFGEETCWGLARTIPLSGNARLSAGAII